MDSECSKRIDGIDSRFDKVENRLENVENELVNVKNRLVEVENRLGNVANRLGNVENDLDKVAVQVSRNAIELVNISAEMQLLETKEDANRKFNTLVEMIDGLTRIVVDFRTAQAAINHTFNRHDKWLNNHETRIQKLETT